MDIPFGSLSDDESDLKRQRLVSDPDADLFLLQWDEDAFGALLDPSSSVPEPIVEPPLRQPSSTAVERRPLHEPQERAEQLAALLSAVERLETTVAHVADNLRATASGTVLPFPLDTVETLRAAMVPVARELGDVDRLQTLTVTALYRLEALRLRVLLVREQLAIYEREVVYLSSRDADQLDPHDFARALFVKQPYSLPIKRRPKREKNAAAGKKKKPQYELQVRILSGAVVKFVAMRDAVTPALTLVEDTRAKVLRGTAIAVEVASTQWDASNAQVTLEAFFVDGTQVVPAVLDVHLGGHVEFPNRRVATTLVTRNANPLVVTTNENQWEQAEGRLLRRLLYGDVDEEAPEAKGLEAQWLYMSNCLTLFFTRATRQDLVYSEALTRNDMALLLEPGRPLARSDLQFVHQRKFGGRVHVKLHEFTEFWGWFGPLLHQYRHNHTIRSLFLRGIIYGLVSKDDCVSLLQNQRAGTFLIRNSERSSVGEFALAFVNSHRIVRHHKIDTKKLRPPFGNLADFVQEKDQLSFLVKPFHQQGDTVQWAQTIVAKNEAIADFCSHKVESNKQPQDYTAYLH